MNNDLINREELKRKLQYVYSCDYIGSKSIEGVVSDIIDEIDNAPTVPLPDFKEGYKQAIIDGETNFSRPQGEWIPVSERLPDKEGDYLVQTYCGGLDIDHFVTCFVFYKSNVVYWQPLPKPYEGEEQ